jgi:hypothetical protein
MRGPRRQGCSADMIGAAISAMSEGPSLGDGVIASIGEGRQETNAAKSSGLESRPPTRTSASRKRAGGKTPFPIVCQRFA